MKVGDLVRRKWITFASMRRQKAMGRPVDDLGLVLQTSGEVSEVLFPSLGSKTHKIVNERLEIICHDRDTDEIG